MYLVGGDPQGWINEAQAAALDKVGTVIVQDILPSPASRRATFVLPGGSFAERDGTFVNHAGLAQEIHRSIRSPRRSEAGRPHPVGSGRAARVVERGGAAARDGRADRGVAAAGDGALGEFGVRLTV